MKATSAYGDLLRMNRKIVTTREAATRWRTEQTIVGGLFWVPTSAS